MGGVLVGVVSCESLFHTVTSGLQSVAVFYYENGTARIICSFASGSLSSGCQVSLSGDQLHYTILINIIRSCQLCQKILLLETIVPYFFLLGGEMLLKRLIT